MPSQERRQLERFSLRVPLRFRTLSLASDKSEHFTEAVNVSRGGFFFVTSAPLQVGMPIEATIKMPGEVTGTGPVETHCRARLVHAKPGAYSDGRMGFGAEIETYLEPRKLEAAKSPAAPPENRS
ncbi:MAG TPA: PilZ domain-containing protein [Candidatus Acidoferrum sp.]